MSPPSYRKAGVYIDRVLTPGATSETIRQAVAHGSMVVVQDDAGIAVQIDKATLAKIDRRMKHYHLPKPI